MGNDSTIARNLGRFFGEIWRGVKSPATKKLAPPRVEVNRTVEERQMGEVVLRRTTIDEVEVKTCDSKNQH